MSNGADMFTPLEAAKYLRVHRETLYDLIRNGTIRAAKVGGRWRIQKENLDQYLQRGTTIDQPFTGRGSWQEDSLVGRQLIVAREDAGKAKRVLVVDDSSQIREFFEIALNKRGHIVATVPSGFDAVEKVKRNVYDMIFIDLLMPDMDSVETLKAIKAIDPDPIIVLIAGHPDGELVTKALGLGPLVLLDKPIRVSDLLKVVEG